MALAALFLIAFASRWRSALRLGLASSCSIAARSMRASQAKERDGVRTIPAKTIVATDNDAKRLARPATPSIPAVVARAGVTKRKLFMNVVPIGSLPDTGRWTGVHCVVKRRFVL